jgi:hypothetical protein
MAIKPPLYFVQWSVEGTWIEGVTISCRRGSFEIKPAVGANVD